MFYKLNPWLTTHPSCVSESGSGAVCSSLRRSTVRRSQFADVTRYGSQRTVPGAVLDVYRYVCVRACKYACKLEKYMPHVYTSACGHTEKCVTKQESPPA